MLFFRPMTITYYGLPLIVADEDFLEYLWEEHDSGVIDENELIYAWDVWARDNLTFISRVRMYIQRQKLRSGWYK
jgi:hypothetical protein